MARATAGRKPVKTYGTPSVGESGSTEQACPQRPLERPMRSMSPRTSRIFVVPSRPSPSRRYPHLYEPYVDGGGVGVGVGGGGGNNGRRRDRLREVPPGYDPHFASHVERRLKDLETMDALIRETMNSMVYVESKESLRHFV